MGNYTSIQWCDSTVNPTTGCDGCELWSKVAVSASRSCYAGNYHETRMSKALPALYSADFTKVQLAPGRIAKAAAWSDLRGVSRPDKPWIPPETPRLIFVSDMSDALSANVPFDYLKTEIIDNVLSAKGRRHVWLWLTKRPSRIALFADWLAIQNIDWPANLWPGTSVTNAKTLNRLHYLLERPWHCFASFEPLREEISIDKFLWGWGDEYFAKGLDWGIFGGESDQTRQKAHPFDLSWARKLISECQANGAPAFVKQLGSNPYDSAAMARVPGATNPMSREEASSPEALELLHDTLMASVVDLRDSHGGDWNEWPEDLRVRDFPRFSEVAGG